MADPQRMIRLGMAHQLAEEVGRQIASTGETGAVEDLKWASGAILRVPSQFPTMQTALESAFARFVGVNAYVTILIESGHRISSGVILAAGDFSHYRVLSVDPEVELSPDWAPGTPLLHLTGCIGPLWGILVNCDSADTSYGEGLAAISVTDQSSLRISAGAGARNAGAGGGLFVHHRSSVVAGLGAVFRGFANGNGLWITHTSDAYLPRVDAQGCRAGAFVSRLSRAYLNGANLSDASEEGLLVRRSLVTIFADGATATTIDRAGNRGIDAYQGSIVVGDIRSGLPVSIMDAGETAVSASSGSFIDLAGAMIGNPAGNGISAAGASRIHAPGATISNCGVVAVRAGGNTGGLSQINIRDATCSGAIAVEAIEGSAVSCVNASLSSSGVACVRSASGSDICADGAVMTAALDGILAVGGRVSARIAQISAGQDAINIVSGEVIANSLLATGSGRNGIFCQAGRVTAVSSDFSGAGEAGVVASRGAHLTLNLANWRMGAADDPADMQISSGAIVSGGGGTGGANVTPNAVTSNGILMR